MTERHIEAGIVERGMDGGRYLVIYCHDVVVGCIAAVPHGGGVTNLIESNEERRDCR